MAKKSKTFERIVFRTFKHGISKGEVIALFIDEIADSEGNVGSYMHIGQHSAADYTACIQATRKATPKEIEPLLKELHRVGYHNIEMMQRRIPKRKIYGK